METRRYISADTLNDLMQFEHVIQVHEDGSITEPTGIYAPEVGWYEDSHEGPQDPWVLLDGFSGQYRYSGPIMHPSEYIGGYLADYILQHPGYYVAVIVDDETDLDEDTGEATNVGWAVAYHPPSAYPPGCVCITEHASNCPVHR